MKNTWGIQFTQIDYEADKFIKLLGLNIGNENESRVLFNEIKSTYQGNQTEPEVVIDLIDEEDGIVEDYGLTREQANEIADKLGQQLKFEGEY